MNLAIKYNSDLNKLLGDGTTSSASSADPLSSPKVDRLRYQFKEVNNGFGIMSDFERRYASRQDVNRVRELYRKDNHADIDKIKQLDLVSMSVAQAKHMLTNMRNNDPKRAPEREANSDRLSLLRKHYDTVSKYPSISAMEKLASSTNSTFDKVKSYFIVRRKTDKSFEDQRKAKKDDLVFLNHFHDNVTDQPSSSQIDDLLAQLESRGSTYFANDRSKLVKFFTNKRSGAKRRAEKAAK